MDLALLRMIQSNPYSFTHRADPEPALFVAQFLLRSTTCFSIWKGGADIVLVLIRDDGIWNLNPADSSSECLHRMHALIFAGQNANIV
jgi:hypothetical protein